MARKQFRVEQIINKLREAEVLLSRGQNVSQVCRHLGVSEQSYYRWRQEYNRLRPHSSLGYRPPAPQAIELMSMEPFTIAQQGTISMTGLT